MRVEMDRYMATYTTCVEKDGYERSSVADTLDKYYPSGEIAFPFCPFFNTPLRNCDCIVDNSTGHRFIRFLFSSFGAVASVI